jgi:predicted CXXCH cytochrome family protein
MRYSSVLFISTTLVALLGAPCPGSAADSCYECHSSLQDARLSKPARLYAKSVHRIDAIGCVGCHGGVRDDPTTSAHKSEDFRGRPEHKTIPRLCGDCHSDARVIRRYNALLPVDQLALYQNSHHGQLVLWKDSDRPPVCTTCHGVHDIRASTDPLSPVSRANVAQLCGGCHSDAAKVGNSKLRRDQLNQWTASAHGKAVVAGDLSAPSCPQCHGAHAATPPAVDSVGQACGQCHLGELSAFDKGPHSKAFRKLGFAECLPCHGSHDVQAVRALALGLGGDAVCVKCHKGDQKPREVARRLNELLQQATDHAAEAKVTVLRAQREGLFIPGTGALMVELNTAVERLRPALHSLDLNALDKPVAAVDKVARESNKIVADARELRNTERRGYYVAIAMLAFLFLLLLAKGRQLRLSKGDT